MRRWRPPTAALANSPQATPKPYKRSPAQYKVAPPPHPKDARNGSANPHLQASEGKDVPHPQIRRPKFRFSPDDEPPRHTGPQVSMTANMNALHLYRALRRQTTYLPDATARREIPLQIRWRFEAANKFLARRSESANAENARQKRQRKYLKEGRVALTSLSRANEGHIQPLLRILLIAYGRTRRRRHNLMGPLTPSPDLIADCNSPEELETIAPQIMALLRSQADRANGGQGDRTGVRRRLPDDLAAQSGKGANRGRGGLKVQTNTWGQPMPQKRKSNSRKKWWQENLERVMPPLGKEEVEDLRARVQGLKEFDLVKRRARREQEEGQQEDGKDVFMNGNRMSRPHKLTGRFMRRLWAIVLKHCCWMEQVEGGKWKVHWGDEGIRFEVGALDGIELEASMFEGVDQIGKKPKITNKKPSMIDNACKELYDNLKPENVEEKTKYSEAASEGGMDQEEEEEGAGGSEEGEESSSLGGDRSIGGKENAA